MTEPAKYHVKSPKVDMIVGAVQITADMVDDTEPLPAGVERRDDGTLHVIPPMEPIRVHVGWWVIYGPFGVRMAAPNAAFELHYTPVPDDRADGANQES